MIKSVIKKIVFGFRDEVLFCQKWSQEIKQFLAFLDTAKWNDECREKMEYRIGILLTPWLGVSVPWYAITIGMILKSKENVRISFVVNDLWNKKNSFYPYYNVQKISILRMLRRYIVNKYGMDVLLLSHMTDMELNEHDKDVIDRLAWINTVRYLGNSIKDIEHEEILGKWRAAYHGMYGKIKSCSEQKWDRIVIPGGVFQETCLFLDIFQEKGIDVITFDSGPGRYQLGINNVAAQNGDSSKTAQEILASKCNKDKIMCIAQDVLNSRMQMRSEKSAVNGERIIQNAAYQDMVCRTYDVVMFCNLEFDTAALGTHDVFRDDYEWIVETIKFVLENTNADIAIRQHPLKKLFPQIPTNEVSIKKLFGENDRVTFIDCDEKINSYNIIEAAKAIIVNTSTVGLEAGMLGKSVITESHSYYHRASFVRYCNNKEQYYREIVESLASQRALNENEKYEACVYYFLTQQCNRVVTDFTPEPSDFRNWTQRTFEELLEDKNVAYMIRTIMDLEAVDSQISRNILSKGENEMKIIGVIPARYKSSRFEGKPLADVCGKPMVWWVYSAAKKVDKLSEVYVATEDKRVEEVCKDLKIPVIMTSDQHQTPNDRIYEVAQKISADIYVVILGDEPLIEPEAIEAVLLSEDELKDLYVTNLVAPIHNPVEAVDCTNNKVVTNRNNEIIYASRVPIPYPKGSLEIEYRKILGISAMSKEALEFYHKTPRSKVEMAEEIDLLRWVENRKNVVAIDYETNMLSVDTPKDLEEVRKRLGGGQNDLLINDVRVLYCRTNDEKYISDWKFRKRIEHIITKSLDEIKVA